MKAQQTCRCKPLLKWNWKNLKIFFFAYLLVGAISAHAESLPFRLHLNYEPAHLNPHLLVSSASNYLTMNLFRNLMYYDDKQGLYPDLAESCIWKKKYTHLECLLRKNNKWSNGTPLVAKDFLNAYNTILNPKYGASRPDWLFSVMNAQKIYNQEIKTENLPSADSAGITLGIRAVGNYKLIFSLEKADPEFLYKLATPQLAPTYFERKIKSPNKNQDSQTITSGPYKISEWKKGEYFLIQANPYYWKKNPLRPNVKYYFILDDAIALSMYQKGEIDFLRRLTTSFISKYKNSKEFFLRYILRFDYIGFSTELAPYKNWRKALSESLNYTELSKLMQSDGQFGCAGLDEKLYGHPSLCIQHNKGTLVPKEPLPFSLTYQYSQQGGDDHRIMGAWLQTQWKNILNLEIPSLGVENKIFVENLKNKTPTIFRKGNTPDWPSCYSALEIFRKGHTENYIRFNSPEFESLMDKLKFQEKSSEKIRLCRRAIHLLLENNWIIPTGPMHLAGLTNLRCSGWKMNQLNQLDLSNLSCH